MKKKFKVLVNSNGEYGNITFNLFDEITIYTSEKPELYLETITIEGLSSYFSNYRFEESDDYFSWDKHIPKDWKLVDVELSHE